MFIQTVAFEISYHCIIQYNFVLDQFKLVPHLNMFFISIGQKTLISVALIIKRSYERTNEKSFCCCYFIAYISIIFFENTNLLLIP